MTDRSVSASETSDTTLAAWRARWSPTRAETPPTQSAPAAVPSVRTTTPTAGIAALTIHEASPPVAQAALGAVISAYRDD